MICCLSILNALNLNKNQQVLSYCKNIVSLFVGKLPSLGNSTRSAKDRLKVCDLLTQFLTLDSSIISCVFETIMIKHLSCDLTQIMDYFTALYHDSTSSCLRLHCLTLLVRTFEHLTDLSTRSQLLATYFPTFLVALSDSDEQCRKQAMTIIKIIENYDSFSKLLKKEKKYVSVMEFAINKRKVYPIKKGQLLDKLDEFIEDIASSHETEIIGDNNFLQNLIKIEKSEPLFEYIMHAISEARTSKEIRNYLRFLVNQTLSSDQLEKFANVLVSIEFKSSLLGKESAFRHTPSLIDFLCHQNTKKDDISENVHDCLLGILDQFIKKDLELSHAYILKTAKKLVQITVDASLRHKPSGAKFDKVFHQIGLVTDIIQTCIINPEVPGFTLKTFSIDLLKAIPSEYLTELVTRMSETISVQLCSDLETFRKL